MKITFDWLKDHLKTNLKEKLPVTKIIKSMRGTPITYPAPNFLLPPLPEKTFYLPRKNRFSGEGVPAVHVFPPGVVVAV